MIGVGTMAENEGLNLRKDKLNIPYDEKSALAFLEALDYMPLAITQAAAYINQL